uniref:Uncharacterized protein n=1 Tax=Anguilla anguilla TaxID=7936 RepID=A0A0E9TEI5_ANGAN
MNDEPPYGNGCELYFSSIFPQFQFQFVYIGSIFNLCKEWLAKTEVEKENAKQIVNGTKYWPWGNFLNYHTT